MKLTARSLRDDAIPDCFAPRICHLCLLSSMIALTFCSHHVRCAEPVQLTTDAYLKQRPDWHPDGSRVVYAKHKGDTIFLYEKNLKTGKETRVTERDAPEYDAVYSRDGARIIFTYDRTAPNQGDLEIYQMQLADRTLSLIAGTQGKLSHEESADWSPDGQQIVFTSTRDGNQEIYRVSTQGGDWIRLTSDPALDAHPRWSPDGQSIVFATNRWGDLEIARMDTDGTNVKRLSVSPGLDDYPVWSPDGRWLAFVSNRTRNFDLYVMDVNGSAVQNLTGHPAIDTFPTWIDDRTIGWVSNRSGGFELWTQSITLQGQRR